MRLRLVTLNVWGLPEPLARDVVDRVEAIAAHLRQVEVDVVCFQEAWTWEVKKRLMATASGSRYPHAWCRKENFGGGGLLVLSRLPILEARFIPYVLKGLPQRIHHADYYAGKGFAHLRLATEGGSVSVVNTHLHAQYAGDGVSEYVGIRSGQVVQLAAYLTDIAEPLLVAGDFNIDEGKPEYRALEGLSGVSDTAVTLDQRQGTSRRANPYREGKTSPDSRIDYVFYRRGVSSTVKPVALQRVFDQIFQIDGRPASYSDHDGLLAEFEISERAPTPLGDPQPQAIALAAKLLEEGRAQAQQRRMRERVMAGAAFAVGSVAFIRPLRDRVSRRRFLRRSLLALPLVAVPSGTGLLVLSEICVQEELQAYDEVCALLRRNFTLFETIPSMPGREPVCSCHHEPVWTRNRFGR